MMMMTRAGRTFRGRNVLCQRFLSESKQADDRFIFMFKIPQI